MKKQLLLGSALLAAISAFSQRPQERPRNLQPDYRTYIESGTGSTLSNAPIGPVKPVSMSSGAKTSTTNIAWNAISGSMNIFGVLTTQQKPLQYNDELDVVSFVHRKSATYVSNPVASPSAAVTGVIVGMVTTNWGADWDSTCMWNNNLRYARYPQGGIYNPVGNTSLSNAYIIGTGPITQANAALGWVGNFWASKKLDAKHGSGWDNVASTAPGAQQFIPNSSPFMTGGVNKVDFMRNDFTSTKDGNVWALGQIMVDANGTSLAASQTTGARIVKGTFVSGVFNLTGDSIIPNVVITSANAPAPASTPMVFAPRMAWNESGSVGYVYFLGIRQGATGRNVGIQPIVYRSVDHGVTWSPIANINFNVDSIFLKPVLNHIEGTSSDTTLKIPLFDEIFNTSVGIDAVVDFKDRLHIGAVMLGCTKKSADSMFVTSHSFSLSIDNETGYSFGHTPGKRPYVYDFRSPSPTDAPSTNWSVKMVDSMSTEGPGIRSGDGGFSDNPWDINPDGNTKAGTNGRLQLSRTAGGKYVLFAWAESDTNFTNGGRKWNHLPNVKVNLMDADNFVTSKKINATNPDEGPVTTEVAANAHMHYIAPKCKLIADPTVAGVQTVDVMLPMTVSNDSHIPLTQLLPNTHWYASAALTFTLNRGVGIQENTINSVNNSVIYPNPAKDNAALVLDMKNTGKVDVNILTTVGQLVKSYKADTQVGENKIELDLKGLATGIYLVNVKSGNANSTKKLVVE